MVQRSHEGFLRQIGGFMLVAEDFAQGVVDAVLPGDGDAGKGLPVTGTRQAQRLRIAALTRALRSSMGWSNSGRIGRHTTHALVLLDAPGRRKFPRFSQDGRGR